MLAIIPLMFCAPNVVSSAEKHYYYLHISSFRVKKRAFQDAERLQDKGYKTITRREQLANLGYWYRVYIGPFSSLQEAKLKSKELRRKKLVDYVAVHKKDSLIWGDLGKPEIEEKAIRMEAEKAAGAPEASADRAKKVPKRPEWFLKDGDAVVFYGDSITARKLYCRIVEQAFRAAARKYNWQPNVKFYIMGYGGKTAKWGLEHLKKVLIKKPTIVTLLWGINDAWDLSWPDTHRLAEHEAALTAQVRALQNAGIRPVILSVPPVDEMRTNYVYNRVLDMYARVQQGVALSTGADFVDIRSAFKAAAVNSELDILMPDGIYPDVAGHRIIAEAILQAWHISR
jgi:lysophospholipase L1-like esterase